jgi:hypothetical protein
MAKPKGINFYDDLGFGADGLIDPKTRVKMKLKDEPGYIILCAGCSFTHGRKGNEWPYASLLPGQTYNIGRRAAGIQSHPLEKFIQKNKDVELTHFIYQVPSPDRQPVDLNECRSEFMTGHGRPNISVSKQLKKLNTKPFEQKEEYLKKAVSQVDYNINVVRNRWPNAKIILLRYEHNLEPLMYEFCKDFYKTMLADYCNNQKKTGSANITYIYEDNFQTSYFKKNGYAAEHGREKIVGVHPNKAGAQLIADKIKEYL